MATKLNFDQLKGQIERLRKDSLDVVANANKIVYGGVQKLADKELMALNDYYKSAVSSIKAARKGDASLKDVAHKQIDLLQDTVNQVIAHARESVGIVAEARAELAKLVQSSAKGVHVTESKLGRAVAPAKKALVKAKVKAEAASKQASKAVKVARKDVKQEAKKLEKTVKTEVKAVEKKVGKITKAVVADAKASARAGVAAAKGAVARVTPTPSANSRASRATSKAKQAVTGAVDSATAAVSSAVTAVVDAVKSAG